CRSRPAVDSEYELCRRQRCDGTARLGVHGRAPRPVHRAREGGAAARRHAVGHRSLTPVELNGRTCVVTGGSGVVGRTLVATLVAAGARVRVVDTRELPPEAHGAELVNGDAGDPALLRRALAGCELVLHLAGRLPQALLSEDGFHAANVEPTEQIVHAGAEAGVAAVVLASTIEIYGAQNMSVPLTEEAELRFTGAYSRS